MTNETRAWSLLTVDGDREYQGNEGYDDDPQTTYRYDNDVANHLRVKAGDVVVIRSSSNVIGIAEITEIVEGQGTKQRFRCPVCSNTNLSQRKILKPQWRCKSNGHEFETPTSETISITTYEARYGSTFRKCGPGLTPAVLAAAVIRPNDQMSIKEIDLAQIEDSLGSNAKSIIDKFVVHLEPPELDDGEVPVKDGSSIETQRKVLREIAVRRGQRKFRNKLIKRYGGACQVTECDFVELLEAAHIDPYAGSGDNSVGNGLLLRSDIHTLFDLGYIGIDPKSLLILVNPSLGNGEYNKLSGEKLEINGTSGPATHHLEKRVQLFFKKIGELAKNLVS